MKILCGFKPPTVDSILIRTSGGVFPFSASVRIAIVSFIGL